jgi:D-aminopeptidase
MCLNGKLAGEFAIDDAIAGDYGIPTIFSLP